MAAIAASGAAQQPGMGLDFLPLVDMTSLTQSELRSLSLLLAPSSDFRRPDATGVIPTVDHFSFNESAGSRRQTYSRPSTHHHHRHRLASLQPKTPNLPNASPPPPSAGNDPSIDSDRVENRTIIRFLKQLVSSHPDFQQSDLADLDVNGHFSNPANYTPLPTEVPFRKRKRGRKPKMQTQTQTAEEREKPIGMEIVNRNGVVVDLVALASLEDPFKDELRRRTEGLEKEEELLGFFRELGGQWCSRRRKRKIIDACEFGDTLPVGWKLLLGLKRKTGRAWVYCRRYIRYFL